MLVTSNLDDGSCGTLRQAVTAAAANPVSKTITLTLSAGSTITLTGGLTLPKSVAITTTARCGSGPGNALVPPITIKGTGNASGDGLILSGNNSLYGLWVQGFSGRQIYSPPTINPGTLKCIRTSKT